MPAPRRSKIRPPSEPEIAPSPPRRHREDKLDEALRETFPASDPYNLAPDEPQHDGRS